MLRPPLGTARSHSPKANCRKVTRESCLVILNPNARTLLMSIRVPIYIYIYMYTCIYIYVYVCNVLVRARHAEVSAKIAAARVASPSRALWKDCMRHIHVTSLS